MLSCEGCGKKFKEWMTRPIICSCGVVFDDGENPAPIIRTPKLGAITASPPNPWRVLHEFPVNNWDNWNESAARAFFAIWEYSVPKGCGCASKWGEARLVLPEPDFSSASGFLDSTIVMHNYVSKEHAKNRTIPDEVARDMWLGPKVVFLATTYAEIGGTETFHMTLLPELRFTKNIIGFCATDNAKGNFQALRVPYHSGWEQAKYLASRADIVVSWGIDRLVDLLPEKRPYVISAHHSDIASGWSHGLQLNQSQVIDEFVCINNDVATYLRKRVSQPVHFIPNAINPKRLSADEGKKEIRKTLNIPKNDKIVLWLHRFSEEKRPQLAMEIAKRLPEGYTVLMVGGGESFARCVNEAPPNVKFSGPVHSPANYLAIADCFLSLATFEGFGLSIGEAMLAGVPVISTKTGIADANNAVIVDMHAAPEAWAKAIVSVDDSRVEAAREMVRSKYGVDEFVRRWDEVISNVWRKASHERSQNVPTGQYGRVLDAPTGNGGNNPGSAVQADS